MYEEGPCLTWIWRVGAALGGAGQATGRRGALNAPCDVFTPRFYTTHRCVHLSLIFV